MHSTTFVLVPVARPILHVGHGHCIIEVVEHKRAGNPLVVSSINTDLPASTSTPVSNDIPNDVPKSNAESSAPIVKPSPTSTKNDNQDSKPTQTPSTGGDGS